MDHGRYHQNRLAEQQRVQQTWDASVRRFHDQQHRYEQQQLGRAYGAGSAAGSTSGLAIAVQIVFFLIVVTAGALFLVTQMKAAS